MLLEALSRQGALLAKSVSWQLLDFSSFGASVVVDAVLAVFSRPSSYTERHVDHGGRACAALFSRRWRWRQRHGLRGPLLDKGRAGAGVGLRQGQEARQQGGEPHAAVSWRQGLS